MTSIRVRRDRYLEALLGASAMSDEVRRAVPVALAVAMTARVDGTHASLSAPRIARLFGYGDGSSDTTARRHLKALMDAGWLEQTERGGRRGKKVTASKYALTMPAPTVHQDGRLGEVPNRPRDTPQPSTQVDASSFFPSGRNERTTGDDDGTARRPSPPSGLPASGGVAPLAISDAAWRAAQDDAARPVLVIPPPIFRRGFSWNAKASSTT